MTAARIVEQFELPADGAAVDPPAVDQPLANGDPLAVDPPPIPQLAEFIDPPADAAPPVETENDRLKARIVELEAELRASRQPETPPDLRPLKRAAGIAGVYDETARRWCADSIVAAKRVGRRWYVDPGALRAHKQLKNAK
jgi:hypothetical protein